MGKNNHHFVPHFYLQHFASEPRRIHVFHVRNGMAYPSGSLRDQCYRRKFYGKTADLEDRLAAMEGKIAPVIEKTLRMASPTELQPDDLKWLFVFMGLQITRTTAAAARINESTDQFVKAAFAKDSRFEGVDLSLVEIGFANPVLHSLVQFRDIALSLTDLGVHLVVNRSTVAFVTSDNPVAMYNKYLEGVRGLGTTGATQSGLQVFLPISPTRLLAFYDRRVYALANHTVQRTVVSSPDDVRALNLLQAANAETVLLFSDWSQREELASTVTRGRRHRRTKAATVDDLTSVAEPNTKAVLHLYQEPLNTGLALSFMRLRRRAQRVSMNVRINEHRDLPRVEMGPNPESHLDYAYSDDSWTVIPMIVDSDSGSDGHRF